MGAHHLVNHNGRVTGPPEREVEQIKQSDILKLVAAVDAAVGLYNALERACPADKDVADAFESLGEKLRILGVGEVKP